MINVLIFLYVALVLSYDFLSGSTQNAFILSLSLMAIVLLARGLKNRSDFDIFLMLIPPAAALCIGVLHILVRPGGASVADEAYIEAAKGGFFFLMLVAVITARKQINVRLLPPVALLFAIVGMVHWLIMPSVILNGTARAAPFSAGLHTSGYIIVAVLILAFEMRLSKIISLRMMTILFFVLSILIFENGVRSPALFALTFFAFHFAQQHIRSQHGITVLALYASCWIFLAAVLALNFADSDSLFTVSSGRTENYDERLAVLFSREAASFLFGTGPGSDRILTSAWWWEEKDSHSDLLRYFWDLGLIGFLSLLSWFVYAYRFRSGILVPYVVAFFVVSLVSNGYLYRPITYLLLFVCMGLRMMRIDIERRSPDKDGIPQHGL